MQLNFKTIRIILSYVVSLASKGKNTEDTHNEWFREVLLPFIQVFETLETLKLNHNLSLKIQYDFLNKINNLGFRLKKEAVEDVITNNSAKILASELNEVISDFIGDPYSYSNWVQVAELFENHYKGISWNKEPQPVKDSLISKYTTKRKVENY